MLAQGGGMKLKRCLTKDKVQLKKQIAGKMRLIYTDDKRHQYVKMNGAFVALRQIKA
jgi:archaeosine-15-forming tRNA-guanine transglycosylase